MMFGITCARSTESFLATDWATPPKSPTASRCSGEVRGTTDSSKRSPDGDTCLSPNVESSSRRKRRARFSQRLYAAQTQPLSSYKPLVPATSPVRHRLLWPPANRLDIVPRQPIPSIEQDQCAYTVPTKCPGADCVRHLSRVGMESLFPQVPVLPSTPFRQLVGLEHRRDEEVSHPLLASVVQHRDPPSRNEASGELR